jgi:hypothetical protein
MRLRSLERRDRWFWVALALLLFGVAIRAALYFPLAMYQFDSDAVLSGLCDLLPVQFRIPHSFLATLFGRFPATFRICSFARQAGGPRQPCLWQRMPLRALGLLSRYVEIMVTGRIQMTHGKWHSC